MAAIYQLMVGKKQINDVYHNENDAVDNAMQIAIDSGEDVMIWMAEEIEGAPYDVLKWRKLGGDLVIRIRHGELRTAITGDYYRPLWRMSVKQDNRRKKKMRIFRSTKDGRTWVTVETPEKGKVTSQRVTLVNEIPEEKWAATKNRFIDYVDIEPPTQEQLELIEEEITLAEPVYDKHGNLVFPAIKRMLKTLKIDN